MNMDCWRSNEDKYKTIADEEIKNLSPEEEELMEEDWERFKGDVSMKQLITSIDRAIKRRRRLYISKSEDPEEAKRENDEIQASKKFIKKWKPLKMFALVLYVFIPFFEKPAWCI